MLEEYNPHFLKKHFSFARIDKIQYQITFCKNSLKYVAVEAIIRDVMPYVTLIDDVLQ